MDSGEHSIPGRIREVHQNLLLASSFSAASEILMQLFVPIQRDTESLQVCRMTPYHAVQDELAVRPRSSSHFEKMCIEWFIHDFGIWTLRKSELMTEFRRLVVTAPQRRDSFQKPDFRM